MEYTIYLRTNLVNGKQYIGQTNDLKQREYNWNCLKHAYAGKLINNAREKYGIDNWKIEIIDSCKTQTEANNLEIYYIKKYNTKVPNGYNLTDGGEGASGYKFSDEYKKKLSDRVKGSGNPMFNVHRYGESNPCYGKKTSEETKEKIRQKAIGRKHTDESKKKMSEKRKGDKHWNFGKHHSEDTKKKISETKDKKEVYQYSLDDKFIRKYASTSEAAKINGFNQGEICCCCKGGYFDKARNKWHKRKTYKGYKWSYKPL